MHILLGFFVAALVLYWWGRGGIVPALMGTLLFVALLCVSDHPFPQPTFLALAGIAASWAPFVLRRRAGRRPGFWPGQTTVAVQVRR